MVTKYSTQVQKYMVTKYSIKYSNYKPLANIDDDYYWQLSHPLLVVWEIKIH